jgi:hypothetical protein
MSKNIVLDKKKITAYIVLALLMGTTVGYAAYYQTISYQSDNSRFIPLYNNNQAQILIWNGTWTAIIYGRNPQIYSNSNYTAVVEWAKENTLQKEPYITQAEINGTTLYFGIDPNKTNYGLMNYPIEDSTHIIFVSTNATFVIQSMLNQYGVKP